MPTHRIAQCQCEMNGIRVVAAVIIVGIYLGDIQMLQV